MFCPNCGNNCGDANFCANCGTSLGSTPKTAQQSKIYPPLKEPYVQEINGKKIDLNKVIRMNQNRTHRGGGYYYLVRELGISVDKAKEILDPVYDAHEGEKVSFWNAFGAQAGLEADKQKFDAENRKRMDAAGQIYCPKCSSTSISANQKGFSFSRGAVGAMAGLDVGLIAGGIGSKKIVCTCLKCGYQWKPGKK